MAADENRKKTGTIFMGQREASVEQLNAMQEPLRKERLQKEQTEDYMERVRARAADRAREILGAAYAERQKVLEEARAEIQAQKRQAAEECAKIKAEGEILRKNAQKELAKAQEEREEAERLRAEAHEAGYQAGMDNSAEELYRYRSELGMSVASVLRALDREKKNIMLHWRDDLSELVRCAVQAGTGYILQKEDEAILRGLVFKALDMLETHGSVTLRVNPEDEDRLGDLFTAVRERFPDLRQWIVNGDAQIEKGSLVAESGSGSVDMRRSNFREMVENIICHLGLPEQEGIADNEVQDIVEREVAHITSLTPELESRLLEPAAPESPAVEPEIVPEIEEPELLEELLQEDGGKPECEGQEEFEEELNPDNMDDSPSFGQADMADYEEPIYEDEAAMDEEGPVEPDEVLEDADESFDEESLEDLEDELFPIEEENVEEPAGQAQPAITPEPPLPEQPDPKALAEGGFV